MNIQELLALNQQEKEMTKELCPKCYSHTELVEDEYFCTAINCGWHGGPEETINEYTVLLIKLDRIWSDNDFNCRGIIVPMDVIDLVKDIDRNGLQFPIAIQPISDVKFTNEKHDTIGDEVLNFDFRIVAGHRRFSAFKVLKRDTIPAMIKVGLSEVQARLLNLGENLKRQALNILQESLAIKRLRDFGLNRRQVGEELGVSTSWVQVRYNLLDLPQVIQEEAAAGILNQYQIKELYGLPNKDAQFEAVKKIKNARLRGEKSVSVGKTPEQDPYKKKRQPKNVVQEMIAHMSNNIGYGLHTRTLAWANGEISSAELFFDIRQYAEDHNIEYKVPLVGTGGK